MIRRLSIALATSFQCGSSLEAGTESHNRSQSGKSYG